MKKFLTVLLALSVVFTYSFSAVGTAFAATDTEKAEALKDAKAVAEKIVNDYYDVAMENIVKDNLGYTEANADEIAAAWAKIDAKADVLAKINDLYIAESKLISAGGSDNYDADANKYAAKVFKLDANSNGKYGAVLSLTNAAGEAQIPADQLENFIINLDGLQAVLEMFNADRAEALGALDKVDYSVYSTAVDKNDADGRTYLKIAEDKIAEAKEKVADLEVYTLEQLDWSFPAWLVGRLNANIKEQFVDTYVEPQKITVGGIQYETGLYLVKGVLTKDKVDANDAVDQATIAQQKASAAAAYAAFIANRGSAGKTFADAWLKVVNFLADKGMLTKVPAYDPNNGTLKDGKEAPIDPANTAYIDAVKVIEDLTTFAEKYKAEKDATGALVRDAEEVDDIVEEYTAYLYGTTYGVDTSKYDSYTTVAKAKETIIASSVDSSAQELAFAKEQYKVKLANDLADLDLENAYYPLEAATVQANYNAGVAKIEAATTPAKVAVAYNNINLTKNAKSATDIDKLCTYAEGSPEKIALDAAEAYVKYANSGKTILDAGYIIWNANDVKDAIEAVYGKAGARTLVERKGITVDTSAIVTELSTVEGLEAAKKAAEEAIKALPATITVDDKDAVVNAWDLADDYSAMTGSVTLSNQSKLDSAKSALLNALKVDFAKKISVVDKTDKEALKALQAEIDAINQLFEEDEIFDGKIKIDNSEVVAKALQTVRGKELDEVKTLIAKLPINVTLEDKTQIEATRTAYDAFVKEWTSYDEPIYNAVAQVTNFRTLALAEAALSILQKDYAIKAVESLKITASSVAAKGSITVKWKVDGDYSAADGMRVYKSTKKNTGFGSKPYFITKKGATQYKNTKELKKGTRYYYKVRAYVVIDGKTYYSDYSNKAYRIAK